MRLAEREREAARAQDVDLGFHQAEINPPSLILPRMREPSDIVGAVLIAGFQKWTFCGVGDSNQ
jgi:hypothetical protein